ncbi:TMEM175 family protein [Fructilactobacillus frigidiflavus]|uniref:TMEM175 family protein n=1 Tax=Fructilactobacillus frigidiflavus TaxID=3242688 RepID=UPI003757247A
MNKTRVEALTDAIVAIIMTVMVLEFKVPESPKLSAILAEMPYLFAYIVSLIFIGVAWYNQHYMFALVKRITKKIYWVNNLWLFTMSLIPVAAGWVGRYIDSTGPEWFYLIIFVAWSLAYLYLSKAIIQQLEVEDSKSAQKIKEMFIYRFINTPWFIVVTIIMAISIFFFPPSGLILGFIELVINGIKTNPDSDNLEKFIK